MKQTPKEKRLEAAQAWWAALNDTQKASVRHFYATMNRRLREGQEKEQAA